MPPRVSKRWLFDMVELDLLQAGYPWETIQRMDADVVVRKHTFLRARQILQQKLDEKAAEVR